MGYVQGVLTSVVAAYAQNDGNGEDEGEEEGINYNFSTEELVCSSSKKNSQEVTGRNEIQVGRN
jgi:hypothetical protein